MRLNNIVVVSDLHCGCRLGLYPCTGEPPMLDEGGQFKPSKLQRVVWSWWREFWSKWVPMVCHGEPYALVVNGDALDGVHHNAVTQVSQNLEDQRSIAEAVLKPVVTACLKAGGRYFHLRGTEAHVGPSGQHEESLARSLGADRDGQGRAARYELWLELGNGLIHFTHHIGTTGSMHYESTAVNKELAEAYAEAGRWRRRPPDVIVRSHRHRAFEVRVPTKLGYGISLVTPGWQLRTPFTYRIAGARQAQPQLGGTVIRQGDRELYTRSRVWELDRPNPEKL